LKLCKWTDGRRFDRRVQVQSVGAAGNFQFVYRAHAEEALRLCRAGTATVPAEDAACLTIWRVMLAGFALELKSKRVSDARGGRSYAGGTVTLTRIPVSRYNGEGVKRVPVIAAVHHMNFADKRDWWAYRMAQLDALGYRWPYAGLPEEVK